MTGKACRNSNGSTGAVRRRCRRASLSVVCGWLELPAGTRFGRGKGRLRRSRADFTTRRGMRYHMVPSLRYRLVPSQAPKMAKPLSNAQPQPSQANRETVRSRILEAAFAAFTQSGYAQASTLDIASWANVSKRELYSLVGNKQEMLVACIRQRAKRLPIPANLPEIRDSDSLARVLISFGMQLLLKLSVPAVIAVYRVAIAEAERVPEIAQALESMGRQATRDALTELLARARSFGILAGQPDEMAEQFFALLWGNLLIGFLLGVAEPPNPNQAKRRARNATTAFLHLYANTL
jgi:AcrR family transcriptional regulator